MKKEIRIKINIEDKPNDCLKKQKPIISRTLTYEEKIWESSQRKR